METGQKKQVNIYTWVAILRRKLHGAEKSKRNVEVKEQLFEPCLLLKIHMLQQITPQTKGTETHGA